MSSSNSASSSAAGGWLSSVLSGAGRILSAAFDSPPPSSSDDDDDGSDDNTSYSFGEDEDVDVCFSDFDEDQRGKISGKGKDCMGGSLAIVSKITPKHAIEQLLMQETFSRDECDKLTSMIRSRVVDFPFVEPSAGGGGYLKEVLAGTTVSYTTPGSWRPMNHARKLPQPVHGSSYSPSSLSPGSALCQAHPMGLHDEAISESKKWLDERKLALRSKPDFECGPCTLNTDLRYDFDGESGSPVDMAKSYMQQLRHSPSLPCAVFKTTPPSGLNYLKNEGPYATADHSSTPLKIRKRNFATFGSADKLDENRRVRLKSAEIPSETSTLKQRRIAGRPSELLEALDERGLDTQETHCHSSSLRGADSIDPSALLCGSSFSENLYLNGALNLCDEKVGKPNLLRTNDSTANVVSCAMEGVNAAGTNVVNRTLQMGSSPSDECNKYTLSDHAVICEGNQYAGEALQRNEPVSNLSIPEVPLQIKEPVSGTSVPPVLLPLAPNSLECDGMQEGNVQVHTETNGVSNKNSTKDDRWNHRQVLQSCNNEANQAGIDRTSAEPEL